MDDAKKDLVWVIFFLIIIAVIWYFTGGPARPASKEGLFLYKPQEKYSEELRSTTEKVTLSTPSAPSSQTSTTSATDSIFKNKASLIVDWNTKQTDPQKEYLGIRASPQNDSPLRITGWALEGKQGLDIAIGQGTYLIYSAQINPQEDIFLYPEEKTFIITGESPVGTSFRLNKCTGYFEQFKDFYPSLPKECPYPKDEDLPANLNDKCLDYIEGLPRCEAVISIPWNLSSACQDYINEKINYNTCVELHKNDPDFYKQEWRIYLGRGEELWKEKRESIILTDQNNKIIDWVSY